MIRQSGIGDHQQAVDVGGTPMKVRGPLRGNVGDHRRDIARSPGDTSHTPYPRIAAPPTTRDAANAAPPPQATGITRLRRLQHSMGRCPN